MRTIRKSLIKGIINIRVALKPLDLFGQNILLNLNGQDQYKTAFGGFLTLMILGIVILFFQSNIQEFIDKVNIQSDQSEVFENEPDSITLNSTNFMFAVAIDQNDFNTQPFFNVTVRPRQNTLKCRQYIRQENGNFQKSEEIIDLIPCTIDQFQKIFDHYNLNFTSQFQAIGLSTWLCPESNYSISMKGRYTNDAFDFIKIEVSQCRNETQNNQLLTWKPQCADNSTVQEWLESQRSFRIKLQFIKLSRYITNLVISPANANNYIQAFLDDELFFSFVPDVFGTETDIFFTKTYLETDQNLLPIGSDTDTKQLILKKQGDYRQQTVYATTQYAALYLRRSPFTAYYSRSYQKLDKLLSVLGGFANIVIVVLGFFVGIYNKQQYLLELANEVYDFHFGNENKAKFERQELVKEITFMKQSQTRTLKHSPAQSINPNLQSINQQSINPSSRQKLIKQECTIHINEDDGTKPKTPVNNPQPLGDSEIEWESINKSFMSNNNQTEVVMFNSTAKFKNERQTKTQHDQQMLSKKILQRVGIHNRKEYLTKQIQLMLDRSKPLMFTLKFILHQLFCGKLFQDKNCVLLDKAIKKINQDLDICVLIDKVNEINFIKELLLDKEQQILFNFAPKEIISIEDQGKQHLPGRRDSKRAFTKRLGVQFSDVAKMMIDKKFKKGQFVNPGLQIYYKLYQAYESVLMSDERDNRFNKILIQKLGSEVKEVFDVSKFIQQDNNIRIVDRIRQKIKKQEESDEIPGLLSMDQRDMKQSIL